MSKMIINHKTDDFTKWKSAFDKMDPVRLRYGSTGATVFRGHSDPNELVVITQWGNPDDARKYSQSPELKEAMRDGGISGDVKVYFVE